ncbi:MAG: hypothetical protein HY874_01770 [Chloroflexi bacterium]|nr:hypothetical protein [Chloroflexota bacterium]
MTFNRSLILVVAALTMTAAVCGAPSPDGTDNPTSEGKGPDLPSAFTVSRITDFEQAAAVVGFAIPKSDQYPLHWGYVFVQPASDLEPNIPRTAANIYEVDGHFVEVTLGPSTFWPEDGRKKGEQRILGGRQGWYFVDKYQARFSTPYSNSDRFGEIWMLVDGPPEAGPLLESFVASLRPPP